MGCLFRLGCLAVLLVAAVVGWLTRDHWWPGDRDQRSAVPTWERLSPEGAVRTRATLRRLEQPSGPVFASLSGADVASYVFLESVRAMPSFADSAEAAVVDDQLVVRAVVPLRELGGVRDLGPFAGMLGEREPVQIAGRLRVRAPGQGELTVTELKVRDFKLPTGMIPRLLGQPRSPDASPDPTIPVRLPLHVGDVRLAGGRVTLYKNVP